MFYLYLSLSRMGGIEERKEAIAEEWLLVMNYICHYDFLYMSLRFLIGVLILVMNEICHYALADNAYMRYVITLSNPVMN